MQKGYIRKIYPPYPHKRSRYNVVEKETSHTKKNQKMKRTRSYWFEISMRKRKYAINYLPSLKATPNTSL